MSKVKQFAGEKLDERFGKGFSDRVMLEGLQDPTDSDQYSKKELLAEFRRRPDGVNIDEGEGSLVGKFQALADSGTRFNKQAEDYLAGHGVIFNKPQDAQSVIDEIVDDEIPGYTLPLMPQPSSPVQTITTNSSPDEVEFVPNLSGGGFDFDQTLNVNQDNDIYNAIYGSNNNVSNFQDNSIQNTGIAGYSDGQYAQRNPNGFLRDKMFNLFN